jgi:hypothetical protein
MVYFAPPHVIRSDTKPRKNAGFVREKQWREGFHP